MMQDKFATNSNHGISKQTYDFLKSLKKNNNKAWFNANKSHYQSARDEFELFVDLLIAKVGKFDQDIASLDARECIFRIFRDVRFSRDKSPYKTNLGAWLVKGGKKTEHQGQAGYYIHIELGNSFLAAGSHQPPSSDLNLIRKEIEERPNEFKHIIQNKEFVDYFGGLSGEKLKTNPQGFSKDHPEIELLRHKSYLAEHKLSDAEVQSDTFLNYTAQIFRAVYPFNRFLNNALR